MELDPPPGNWAAATSPTNDDQVASSFDQKAQLGSQQQLPDWDTILRDRHSLLGSGPFFLELFAGRAGLTEAFGWGASSAPSRYRAIADGANAP